MLKTFLGLDITHFRQQAGKADQTMGQFASSAKKHLAGVAGALGVGLSAAGAWRYLNNLAAEMDAIGKGAARLSVGTEEFQAMSYAAERSGASMDIMEKSMQRVRETVYMAKEGNQQAVDTLSQLGLSVQKLENLTPDRMLTTFAGALSNVKDELTRVNIARQLFGEGGLRLLPMFNDLERLKKELKDTNRIMSDESVKAAEAYQAAMLNLEKSLQSAVANSGLVGWLADVADRMDKVASRGAQMEKAVQNGAGGAYTDKGFGYASFALDMLTFGQGSTWAENMAGRRGHNPIRMDITPEEQEALDARRAGIRTGTVDTKAEENRKKRFAAYAEAELAAARALDQQDKEIQKTIEKINEEHAHQATAIQAEIDGKQKSYQLSVMIAKIEEETGRRLTQKEIGKLSEGLDRVEAAKKEAEARENAKRFAQSVGGKARGMGYDLLDRLGFGEQAAQGRAVDEARQAAGGKLTGEQEQEAKKLGTLQYQISRLDQNRPVLQDSYITNDLARIGGWSSSVVQADPNDVNKSILEQSKQTNTLLNEVKETVRRIGEV